MIDLQGKKRLTIVVLLCVCTAAFSFVGAYALYQAQRQGVDTEPIKNLAAYGNEAMQEKPLLEDQVHTPVSVTEDKIAAQTKMVYQTYLNEHTEPIVREEYPPYFMIGMDREAVSGVFNDWQILSFSSQEVILKQNKALAQSASYIIGVLDGYITVFYKDATGGSDVKEMTNMPVSAFSAQEQEKLQKGIVVEGEEKLIKLLEDYGS